MSGVLAMIAFYAVALGMIRLGGMAGRRLALVAAALAIAGAGFALQGQPSLPGASRLSPALSPPPSLAAPRAALMGQFTTADRWQIIADSFAQRGQTADAVGVMRAAIRAHPGDYQLWVGLGNALTDHARRITPPAAYAYDRADALAPLSPAPRFFRGLALVRSGRTQEGTAQWRDILVTAPVDARWRPLVEDALTSASALPRPPR